LEREKTTRPLPNERGSISPDGRIQEALRKTNAGVEVALDDGSCASINSEAATGLSRARDNPESIETGSQAGGTPVIPLDEDLELI
jgi:hypothetical protein